MAPKPYSDKSSLTADSPNVTVSRILSQTPQTSPSTTGETTPSPTLQEEVLIEPYTETVVIQEINRMPDFEGDAPCYPTPEDIMPYDHSLPDFIKQITNQPNLVNLHSLRLKVISTLISLHRMSKYLPNLRELDLEGSVLNSLRDIGCNFKNLQILKVGRCQLTSLDGTFGLSSLRELHAQNNFINDVSPCSNLPHIRHINVSHNRIRNISYAGFLSVCTKLRSIIFTGNPATEVPDYRKHVSRILPQIESLDGIPFCNEDDAENSKESEQVKNICEESDSSSTEFPDFSLTSPSDSMNNFFESEEDTLHLDKNSKQAKNLASQDQTDNVDYEVQEFSSESKSNLELQDDFRNLSLFENKVRKEFLEQGRVVEDRDANIKQKCVSIRKLDKDIENRTKKSNLLINANLNEELTLPSDFSNRPDLEGSNICSPSTSGTIVNTDELKRAQPIKKKSERPSTSYESSHNDLKPEEMKSETIKKRPSSAVFNPTEQSFDPNREPSILTTGLPICGNLTAALRTRKKIQNAWSEKQDYLSQKFNAQSGSNEGKGPESQENGSGDFLDTNFERAEDELVEKDILAISKKWREAFRNFRSDNRARWEEEDESDYSNLLREISDSDDEGINEKNKSITAK